jgi:adenylate cyclase
VLDGSVRRAGDRVRIVAELVDAATDEPLWAETYDRQLTDVFQIQSDVALRIAEALQAELTAAERARIQRPTAVDFEAYQLFLEARQCFHRYTESELARALALFERAVAIEPRYALAHNGIAWVYLLHTGGHAAGAMKPDVAADRARTAVQQALASEPLCGDAHGTLGALSYFVDFDWPTAERAFHRGLELSPGSAFMLEAYALMLSAQERFDAAIAVQRRARELDPLAPVIASDLATSLLEPGAWTRQCSKPFD